jgi:multiple sugar transport system ATP-binding protein
MPDITLSAITKSHGPTPVLKGIDLHVPDGEFLTLVGPSGCGKSTLLRIIAGLEEPTSGEVRIGGGRVDGLRPSRRDLAMVFQSYALYPHLTVRENMLTPLRLRDLTRWERLPLIGGLLPGQGNKVRRLNATVAETARTLHLEALLDRKPGQLSGGQRQRVALGRAMVRSPAAFLMDEPLSNLDAALRVHMRAELTDLHRSLKTTFLYVTHDQAEALTMSDRVAVLMEGEILQVGTPEEIYRDPRDRRVAEFIGSPRVNMLPGEIGGDGGLRVGGVFLGGPFQSHRGPVGVGLRPEHLSLAPIDQGSAHWPFTLTHKENLGSDIFLHGHLNGPGNKVVARAAPEVIHDLSIGATVGLRANPDKALVFGADRRRLFPREV